MTITAMNHFTVLAEDVQAAVAFYTDLLGLEAGPRPDLGFPGAWLYRDGAAILHIVGGGRVPDPPAGVIDHIAFSASGLPQVQQRLDAAKVDYRLGRQPGTRIWQLFCFDPHGARVELDFDPAETPAHA